MGNPSSLSQCFDPLTHAFSLESDFKLKRKRETEKEDAFYESSLDLLTQSLKKPILTTEKDGEDEVGIKS